MIDRITWFDHASFLLEGERRVYIDPWEITGGLPADLVLVSHDHYDHCSPDDVARIAGAGTVIVTTADCAGKFPQRKVEILAPGQRREILGVTVEGVAAYNPDKKFHPRANGWLGFVVTLRGKRIYFVGDSDVTPEMKKVKADIILVPVGGTYTMDAAQAAAAIDEMKPALAIPYHWGKIVGSSDDAQRFASLCRSVVKILPKTAAKIR